MDKVRRFAWLPTVVSGYLIWLRPYQRCKSTNFPILCDCETVVCEHNRYDKDYYNMFLPYQKPGFFSIKL